MNISRKIGLLVFVGLMLVVSMASATILDKFGEISGEADVEGPTFYVAEIDGEDVLKVNEAPEEDENFLYRKLGPDYSNEFFVSPGLEPSSWYNMTVDMYVKAKAVNGTNSGNVQASFLYDTENQKDILICSEDIKIDSTDYAEFSNSCSVGEDTNINSDEITNFVYKLDGGREEAYRIQADGVTRVEVNAQ